MVRRSSNSAAPLATVAADRRVMSASERRYWGVAQFFLLLVVALINVLLFVRPELGLMLLWNVLVPAAPLLLLLMPGVWRNICPLATLALSSHRIGLSFGRLPGERTQGLMGLVGVIGLLVLVPMRHMMLDRSGPFSGVVLLLLGAAAVFAGTVFANKSGWCAGLCPIHPVERLYGPEAVVRPRNVHCATCVNCSVPCPDSVPALDPLRGKRQGWPRAVAGTIMLGGFPGFIFGWFHVPDSVARLGIEQVGPIYALPLLGALITVGLFVTTRMLVGRPRQQLHSRLFAATAIATYYYFRLPALVGWTLFAGDGVLVDLRETLPPQMPNALRALSVGVALWFLVGRRSTSRAWTIRPPVAGEIAVDD
jgi:hypothetical protein